MTARDCSMYSILTCIQFSVSSHTGIGIGIGIGLYYWVLGALFGIVLTLIAAMPVIYYILHVVSTATNNRKGSFNESCCIVLNFMFEYRLFLVIFVTVLFKWQCHYGIICFFGGLSRKMVNYTLRNSRNPHIRSPNFLWYYCKMVVVRVIVCNPGWLPSQKTWKSCGILHWSEKSQGN